MEVASHEFYSQNKAGVPVPKTLSSIGENEFLQRRGVAGLYHHYSLRVRVSPRLFASAPAYTEYSEARERASSTLSVCTCVYTLYAEAQERMSLTLCVCTCLYSVYERPRAYILDLLHLHLYSVYTMYAVAWECTSSTLCICTCVHCVRKSP